MRTLLLAAAVGLLSVSCKSTEYPDEYLVSPVIGEVTFSPESPADREVVTVRAKVSSETGIKNIYILYQLDGEEDTTIVGERNFSESGLTTVDYEGRIPGQRAGSIVKFLVFARSKYGIGAASVVQEYVVNNTLTPAPEQ